MASSEQSTESADHHARAQALFDAVLRSRGPVADAVRLQCAAAVSIIGLPFPVVVAARDAATEAVFDLDPSGEAVEAALVAALRELGRLPVGQFERVLGAAEAGHDALLALH